MNMKLISSHSNMSNMTTRKSVNITNVIQCKNVLPIKKRHHASRVQLLHYGAHNTGFLYFTPGTNKRKDKLKDVNANDDNIASIILRAKVSTSTPTMQK